MGARDLYIAEVYDVERTGETKKPYGRVFYTKGKSLIFYAYDLDQQAGAKSASSFQAWGRRGPDRQQALNLGVFYADSTSTKRWVLRFDDPKALEQIDAVFVTVEPNGGSHKPSPKSLLFAYLRLDPNHPGDRNMAWQAVSGVLHDYLTAQSLSNVEITLDEVATYV